MPKRSLNDRKVEPAASSCAHDWQDGVSTTQTSCATPCTSRSRTCWCGDSNPFLHRGTTVAHICSSFRAVSTEVLCDCRVLSLGSRLEGVEPSLSIPAAIGEQRGNCTRSTARGMRSYVCQLLIRSLKAPSGLSRNRRSVSPVYPSGSF